MHIQQWKILSKIHKRFLKIVNYIMQKIQNMQGVQLNLKDFLMKNYVQPLDNNSNRIANYSLSFYIYIIIINIFEKHTNNSPLLSLSLTPIFIQEEGHFVNKNRPTNQTDTSFQK